MGSRHSYLPLPNEWRMTSTARFESSLSFLKERGLTGRSTGAPTAGHLAREAHLAHRAPRGQGVHVFVFRGRRGDILKVLWFDGQGLMLLAKRLERGRFVWPQATAGGVALTPAQLSMLLEGIDWRMPVRTHTPELAA